MLIQIHKAKSNNKKAKRQKFTFWLKYAAS